MATESLEYVLKVLNLLQGRKDPFLKESGGQGNVRVVSDPESGLWYIPASIPAVIPNTQ